MSSFPKFKIQGTPQDLGHQAGTQFGHLISENYSFYQDLFAELLKLDPKSKSAMDDLGSRIEKYATLFSSTIKRIFPNYSQEIDATANAAKLPAWKVYALNARTEIYKLLTITASTEDPGECTALYFPKNKILGQNWDWHPRSEELTIILEIQSDTGHKILTLTEPGIIGKIGLNACGLGVCLNILTAPCNTNGIPIHIALRAVLDSKDLNEATAKLDKIPKSTASNLIIADRSGAGIDIEFKGEKTQLVKLENGALIHTNHYLEDQDAASATIPGSVLRLARAKDLYNKSASQGVNDMKTILTDRFNNEFPICRDYSMGIDFVSGTVASIIMDLGKLEFHIAKGQTALKNGWETHKL